PVLAAHLKSLGIQTPPTIVTADGPQPVTAWVKAQLGNRAEVKSDGYIGLLSSQQMVIQERLSDPPLRQALARNIVVKARLDDDKVEAPDSNEVTDDGLEELGLV